MGCEEFRGGGLYGGGVMKVGWAQKGIWLGVIRIVKEFRVGGSKVAIHLVNNRAGLS